MLELFTILSALLTVVMQAVKQYGDENWDEVSDSLRGWIYFVLSLVLGLAGSFAIYVRNPAILSNDALFSNDPILGVIVVGLCSVLPGGLGLGVINLLLGKRTIAEFADSEQKFRLWG